MNTGILTYYNVHNHGAVLQANALKLVLKSLSYEAVFLSFERNYDNTPKELVNKYKINLNSLKFFYEYLKKNGSSNILYNLKKRAILNSYRNRNLPVWGRFSDFSGSNIVIGSDEVFSIDIGTNPCFYGHGLKSKNNISYAASFGPTSLDLINDFNLKELIKSGLSTLKSISVRDYNSFEILKSLGIESRIVCDPVILYGYEKEQQKFIPKEKDYIVIYSYDKNMNLPEEVSCIRKFANEKKLRILSVGYYHKWCDSNINVTPEQLLGYIKNAKLVITDTFHGTVLSLICNTDFVVKIRGNNNKLGFLLNEYELTKRTTNEFENLNELFNVNIDFGEVNKRLQEKRENSLDYLKRSLGVD